MSHVKLFVLDPYHPDAIRHLEANKGTTQLVLCTRQTRQSWYEEADGILIRSETRITAADLAKATRLRVIVKQGSGIDNVDLAAAKEAGVVVCNTPGINGESVAELTLGLALCLARHVAEFDRKLRRGETVVRSKMLGLSLFERTIGVVGMGHIGRLVARKWIGAMSGRVVAYDPYAPEGAWDDIRHQRVHRLDELLDLSDVVTVHVPLTAGTRNMIGTSQLERMKTSAILLNCSRGGIVDESALADALSRKLIYGAALDATEVDPPTLRKYETLLQNENVIITPHVGASTEENQRRSGIAAAQFALDALAGKEVGSRLA